jgi:prepilin-type processing-associated H-X9-DG protein
MVNRTERAFTLLEVVVTFAVLALTAAVIIPPILKVRARMGDITCQNNLRQLSRALEMYCLDRNGSMPFGVYYAGSGPPTWAPPPGGNNEYISWASELNRYLNPPKGYAPAFQCPDAQQQAGPHPVSYVMNFIVAVTPYYELLVGQPPRAQTKPPSMHLMLNQLPPGTALMWDTPIRPDAPFPEGQLVGADIDGQRFWQGARSPQYRYYSPHDVFGRIPPGIYGNNKPVVLNVGSNVYRNIDPPANTQFPYQGNLRFRHDDQTKCNVLFSDGSVRQLTAVVRADLTVQSHDSLRRYFMIHWPPGTPADPSVPS